jgi:hypothetical protein
VWGHDAGRRAQTIITGITPLDLNILVGEVDGAQLLSLHHYIFNLDVERKRPDYAMLFDSPLLHYWCHSIAYSALDFNLKRCNCGELTLQLGSILALRQGKLPGILLRQQKFK